MTRIALCAAVRELLIVIFRLSLMASLDDSLSADIERNASCRPSRTDLMEQRGGVKRIANQANEPVLLESTDSPCSRKRTALLAIETRLSDEPGRPVDRVRENPFEETGFSWAGLRVIRITMTGVLADITGESMSAVSPFRVRDC